MESKLEESNRFQSYVGKADCGEEFNTVGRLGV